MECILFDGLRRGVSIRLALRSAYGREYYYKKHRGGSMGATILPLAIILTNLLVWNSNVLVKTTNVSIYQHVGIQNASFTQCNPTRI